MFEDSDVTEGENIQKNKSLISYWIKIAKGRAIFYKSKIIMKNRIVQKTRKKHQSAKRVWTQIEQ